MQEKAKSPLGMSTSHIEVLFQVPAVLLPVRLPADEIWETPATHVEDSDEVRGSWLGTGPGPYEHLGNEPVCGGWLSLAVFLSFLCCCAFQIDENKQINVNRM